MLLPLTLKWASETKTDLRTALAKITQRSAAVLGIAHSAGALSVGMPADLCVFDPDAPWKVSRETLLSQSQHTPYLGYEVLGRVRVTVVDGRVAYEGADRR
jgi:dihydroorotase